MNDIYTTRISEIIESVFANMEQRISAEIFGGYVVGKTEDFKKNRI